MTPLTPDVVTHLVDTNVDHETLLYMLVRWTEAPRELKSRLTRTRILRRTLEPRTQRHPSCPWREPPPDAPLAVAAGSLPQDATDKVLSIPVPPESFRFPAGRRARERRIRRLRQRSDRVPAEDALLTELEREHAEAEAVRVAAATNPPPSVAQEARERNVPWMRALSRVTFVRLLLPQLGDVGQDRAVVDHVVIDIERASLVQKPLLVVRPPRLDLDELRLVPHMSDRQLLAHVDAVLDPSTAMDPARQLDPAAELDSAPFVQRIERSHERGAACLPFFYAKVHQLHIGRPTTTTNNHQTVAIRAHLFDQAIHRVQVETSVAELAKRVVKWSRSGWGYLKRSLTDRIVPEERYSLVYLRLKRRHGHWVRQWEESSDPQKCVWEETAIAAYLICLWQDEERRTGVRPSFVDVGCGNGFLTNVLVSEGYCGVGVDGQRRDVWNRYEEPVRKSLRVESLDPSSPQCCWPDHTWLVGNHSDELTPWVPVMAARTGASFLVLPCCFYGFFQKFQRNDTRNGQYATYLDWVERVCNACGYRVDDGSLAVDQLRIPSTKNMALIARHGWRGGAASEQDHRTFVQTVLPDIPRSLCESDAAATSTQQADLFKPRSFPTKRARH